MDVPHAAVAAPERDGAARRSPDPWLVILPPRRRRRCVAATPPIHPMRVLVQRVSRAEVRVHSRVAGRIGPGLLLLVGFTHVDGAAEIAWMADKVLGLRIFGDAAGRMNLPVADVGGAVLVVSQFTLYGDARKGKRPSFVDAARLEAAIELYERFVATLRGRGASVQTGEFGAMMEVDLVNDGPVTLVVDAP